MRYVLVGRAKSVQNAYGELIKVNRVIHKCKRVNIFFDILHIIGNSLITLLRTDKILVMGHDPSIEGEAYVFLRVVQVAQDVAKVEMNCTSVVYTDPTIALRINWSCLS